MHIYALYICFIAPLRVMSSSLRMQALNILIDDLERRTGRHANETRMTILRGMGDITDNRIQIQLFKIISFSPISFKYTLLHPGSKIRVHRWAEETSLTGCIDWMEVSLSWEDMDSLSSVRTCCIWRNLFCSGNGLSKSIDRKRMGGCLEVMCGVGSDF